MIEVLLVGENGSLLTTLSQLLAKQEEVITITTNSGHVALDKVGKGSLTLVIIDEKVEAKTGSKFAEEIIMANPMLNLALVSDLPADEFHEATEGLGVLAQLPTNPSANDVNNLINRLQEILNMSR